MGSKDMLKGAFEGLQEAKKETRLPIKEVKKETVKEVKKKRSYLLSMDTIKSLEELKLYKHVDLTREEIIELAVKTLYKTEFK